MAIGFNLSNKIGGGAEAGTEVYIDNVQVALNEIRLKTADIMPALINIEATLSNGAVNLNNELNVISSTRHVKWNGSEWSIVSNLPHSCTCLTLYNNELHIFGGAQSSEYTAHLKWNGSEWSTVSTLPLSNSVPKHAIVFNNDLYIFYDSSLYKFDNINTNWTKVSDLPFNSNQSAICVYNNKIHVLGGPSGTSAVNNHYTFDSTNWTKETDLTFDCYNSTAIAFNNKLHLLGVRGSNATWKEHYTFNSTSWTQETDLPFGLIGGSSAIYNNKLVVLGGTGVGLTRLFFYLNDYLVESMS